MCGRMPDKRACVHACMRACVRVYECEEECVISRGRTEGQEQATHQCVRAYVCACVRAYAHACAGLQTRAPPLTPRQHRQHHNAQPQCTTQDHREGGKRMWVLNPAGFRLSFRLGLCWGVGCRVQPRVGAGAARAAAKPLRLFYRALQARIDTPQALRVRAPHSECP